MEYPKALQVAVDSLTLPVLHFIETGIFKEQGDDHITYTQVRKIARRVAKELKRPFISTSVWTYNHDERHRCILRIPRLKYLSPVINPLILAANPQGPRWWDRKPGDPHAIYVSGKSLLTFEFTCPVMFEEYLLAMATRPEMRAALRLPPLPHEVTT